MPELQPDTNDESESATLDGSSCLNPVEEYPHDCPGPDSDAGDLDICWPCHHYREMGRLPVPYKNMVGEGSS